MRQQAARTHYMTAKTAHKLDQEQMLLTISWGRKRYGDKSR